jgi:hypothetical protein
MPLKKLQEIIIGYAREMYYRGQALAHQTGQQYPYKGPAFEFHAKDGYLQITDNTEELVPHPDPDVGLIPVPVDHRPFNAPESTKVNGAYLKYNYWEKKIGQYWKEKRGAIRDDEDCLDSLEKEYAAITTKLISLALEILGAVGESYSVTWSNSPDPIYTDYPHCDLRYLTELRVESKSTVPAEIQLLVEEFNDLLEQKKEKIEELRKYLKSIRHINTMNAVFDGPPSGPGFFASRPNEDVDKSAIQNEKKPAIGKVGSGWPEEMLQEVIVDYANNMYRQALWLATKTQRKYPYKGPAFAFFRDDEGFLALQDNTIDQSIPPVPDAGIETVYFNHGDFDEPKSEEVKAAYRKYSFWEKIYSEKDQESNDLAERGDDAIWRVEERLQEILTTKLIPLALEVLQAVSASYSISWLSHGEVGGERVFCRLSYTNDQLKTHSDTPAGIQVKVEKLNYLIEEHKAMWIDHNNRTQQFAVQNTKTTVPIPTTPATMIPVRPATQPDSRKPKKKTRKPNPTEEIIIDAINETEDGLPALDSLCVLLDNNAEAKPRWTWKEKAQYPWPGEYVTAYNSKDIKARLYWRKLIRKYVDDTKKVFSDKITVTDSQR